MNNILNQSARKTLGLGLICLIELSFGLLNVHAGLTFTVDLIRYSHGNSYRFYTPLDTNSIPPAAPFGMYFISSPQWPTNGSWRQIAVTSNGVDTLAGYENSYSDFSSLMQQLTNGTWSILFTNATTTNLYTFTVSAHNMTSNLLPATIITFPSDGSLNVPNQPTFTWQGPTSWPVTGYAFVYGYYINNYGYSFSEYTDLPATQTSWSIPVPIPNGQNCTLTLPYKTNYVTSVFAATTPLSTNSSQTAISGWTSATTLETGDDVSFAVTNPSAAGISLVAHYTFDNSGNLGQDTSGHGYDLNYDGGSGVTSSSTAAAGSGAASFNGGSFFSYTSTPSNVLSTLAGDFTLSFWIKTSQNNGNENGQAYAGAGILTADVPGGQYYDLVPAALDGGQIGFNTGHYDDTVNSITDVNNGNYHHIAITRNQSTGEKKIYVDGSLDNSQFATLNPLSDPRLVAIGCQIDASQSDPSTAGTTDFFNGLLDDIQIYSGVLSAGQVSQLYANPGSTTAVSGAGHTLIAHYTFDVNGNEGLDSTGNGNDINCGSSWGLGHVFTTDAIAGGGALQFFGGSSITPCDQAFTSWTNTLAGSFSVSAWIKTTTVVGNDDDDLGEGSGQSIIYADNNNLGATPVALTGSKVAFRTTDPDGNDDTLHSILSVTTGDYVQIVSTRDQSSGEKKIYINGVLDSSDFASTESLTGAQYVSIGGEVFSAYTGLVDDVQIYSGVLSAGEVAYLYANPGTNVFDTSGQDFNMALNTTGLAWTTSGDAFWFVETTNSHDNVAAAQSGSVTGYQSSTLSVTVTGPGTLTFYWSSIAEDPNGGFDYEFDIDGVHANDISGDSSWIQDGPYQVGSGQHTFTWTTYANGDTDPTQAGFLDQVSFANSGVPLAFSLTVIRQTYASYQPFVTGQTAFYAFPGLSGSDTPISYHFVESPNNDCNATFGPTNGGAGASIFLTFDELANSLTNGNWKLWLNKDTPQEKLFIFTVNTLAFSSNSLAPVIITTPLDGASAVATNTPYQWTGPNNWSNLIAQAWLTRSGTNFYYDSANLPVTAVSWPAGPTLLPGTNFFYVEYDKDNITNFVVGSPYPEWSVGNISYQSGATAGFLASGVTALPATLLNPKNNNTNFQFQFLSQASHTHAVQFRTNLVTGSNWQTYSNVTGDGTLKTIPIPLSVFNGSRQGFIRVSTQ